MSLTTVPQDLGLTLLFAAGLLAIHLLIGLFQRGWGLKRGSFGRWRVDALLDLFVEEDYTFKKHFLLRFAGLVLVLFLIFQVLRHLR